MSDCSIRSFWRELPRGHYLNGYRDGVSDSVRSWEPAYNELEQRYQQLEQVAKELLAVEEYESGRKNIVFHSRLKRCGVSLDD